MTLKDQAAELASKGRHGDTLLAHISEEEAALLKALGGSGTINPETGLPEFWGWSSFFSPISNLVSSVGSLVQDVVIDPISNIASSVDDAIIQPVVDTIENVVEDPKKLAMVALSTMAPGAGTALGTALGLSGTAAAVVGNTLINTAINGGDVQSALLASAIPIVGKEVAGTAAQALADTGLDKALSDSAGKIVAQTGMAAATGRDPLQALLSGGLQEAIPSVTGQIEGFNDMSPKVQAAVNRAIGTTLMGGDPSMSLINAAIAAGKDAAKSAAIDESIAVTDTPLGESPSNQEILDAIGYTPDMETGVQTVPTEEEAAAGADDFLAQFEPYLSKQTEQFTTLLDQYRELGMTEAEANQQALADLQQTVTGQGEQFEMLLQQYRDLGMSEYEATQQAISDMGQDFTDLLGQSQEQTNQALGGLGTTISNLGTQLGSAVSGLTGQLSQQAQQQTAANAALQQQLAQQGQQQGLMNMLMLMGVMGADQQQPQQPVQTPAADVKSFEEQGYGELFGPKLQFSEGGGVDDLLKYLRG